MTVKGTFLQKLGNNLLPPGRIEPDPASPKTVFFILKKSLQGNHEIVPRQVGGDMIRISNADIGRGIRGNIRYHIIINLAIIRIQPQIHRNIGIKLLKIINSLLIDGCLSLVRVVLSPEGNLIIPGIVKFLRNLKGRKSPGAMAPGQDKKACRCGQGKEKAHEKFCHPLVPPLETPSIIFLWKIRNRITRGTEITTTAAIIAGIFSRPKPFSRIS